MLAHRVGLEKVYRVIALNMISMRRFVYSHFVLCFSSTMLALPKRVFSKYACIHMYSNFTFLHLRETAGPDCLFNIYRTRYGYLLFRKIAFKKCTEARTSFETIVLIFSSIFIDGKISRPIPLFTNIRFSHTCSQYCTNTQYMKKPTLLVEIV